MNPDMTHPEPAAETQARRGVNPGAVVLGLFAVFFAVTGALQEAGLVQLVNAVQGPWAVVGAGASLVLAGGIGLLVQRARGRHR